MNQYRNRHHGFVLPLLLVCTLLVPVPSPAFIDVWIDPGGGLG
jgi:hypothetical protein